MSVQNMVAYVMLPIVIFVLVYSLTISEAAVTFPDTPLKHTLLGKLCHYTHFLLPQSCFSATYFLNVRF